MYPAPIESIPSAVNHDRDDAFFAITASLFGPAFVNGASVLLASYDADQIADKPEERS